MRQRRILKTRCFALLGLACAPLFVWAQAAQTIFKFVDEGGRVTYSNSPIKGATAVDLQPITVLPASPLPVAAAAPPTSGTTNSAIARVSVVADVKKAAAAPALTSISAPATKSTVAAASAATANGKTAHVSVMAVAKEVPATVALPPSAAMLSAPAADALANPSRPAEGTRADGQAQRNLRAALLAEHETLANAKAALAEESTKTDAVRALRTTAGPGTSGANLPIAAEMRARVEHHFERIRDLQDEVAMHERNIAELRAQLRAAPSAGVLAAQ